MQFSSLYGTFLFNSQKIKGYIRYRLDTTNMFPVRFLKRMALDTTQAFYSDPEALFCFRLALVFGCFVLA